jgi:hypothetical protein
MKAACLSLFVILLGTGCATKIMIPYKVTSVPPGAPIEVNGIHMGNTPTDITLGTTKRWAGLCVAPGGWEYGNETYAVTTYPPPDTEEHLYSQTKVVRPQETLEGASLFFDLRLESVRPTQPIEIK